MKHKSIYISGIAQPSPAMRLYAKKQITRAIDAELNLFTGAHPKGIDDVVRTHCKQQGYPYGLVSRTAGGVINEETLDQYMVRSDAATALVDQVVLIGVSPETEQVRDFAVGYGKIVHWVVFSGDTATLTTLKPPEEKPLEQDKLF